GLGGRSPPSESEGGGGHRADRAGTVVVDRPEPAADAVGVGQLLDVDDLDQLVELAGDLVQLLGADVDDDRHAGDLAVLGRADDEVVDVEVTPGEEDRDAGQDAGVVLDQDGQGVPGAGGVV